MATRALVLVHDAAPSRRERIPGALTPALATREIKHDVLSFVSGHDLEPDLGDCDLLVVMGSGESAYDDTVPWLASERAFVSSAIERGLPVIGICFGAQLLARQLGGTVRKATRPETGFTTVATIDPELVSSGPWMQFHSDVFVAPAGTEIARNTSGSQAFVAGNVLGVQFHPEITSDSLDSWFEQRNADHDLPKIDFDALRAAVARHEDDNVRRCDRLVGTFCARHLA